MTTIGSVTLFAPVLDELYERVVSLVGVVEHAIGRKRSGPAFAVAGVDRQVVAGVQLLDVVIVFGRQLRGTLLCVDHRHSDHRETKDACEQTCWDHGFPLGGIIEALGGSIATDFRLSTLVLSDPRL